MCPRIRGKGGNMRTVPAIAVALAVCGLSVSVVVYMIDAGGVDVFKTFCMQLKGGATTDEAILRLYHPKIQSLAGLEEAWKASLGDGR
ncbi:MAG: hypothetical protein C0404_08640 [Verrucomicrobia bacterium]|nr:hypothetical protein [Verrucomicrobiota bacterium]